MRHFIELSYNGKAYHGWQNQPKSVSVQEVVEHSLSKLLGNPIAIVGAGRTDAGVHASRMVAHFDTETTFAEEDLIFKLNSFYELFRFPGSGSVANGDCLNFMGIGQRTYLFHRG